MSQLQNNEISSPLTVVTIRGEEFIFLRARDLPTVYPSTLQPIPDRGISESLKVLLWIACGGFGLILLVTLLRPPAQPAAQPIVINNPPEKKRHTSKECSPSGLFGWSTVCTEKEWWE